MTVHFHICWGGKGLDWQAHATREDAEALANEIARPNEKYTIEPFVDDDCLKCKSLRKTDGPTVKGTNPLAKDKSRVA